MLKASNKMQNPSMINILSNVGIEEKFLNPIKSIYENSTVNVTINSGRVNDSPMIRNKARRSVLTTVILHCSRSPNQCNKARKRKHIQMGNEEVKLPFSSHR